MKNAIREFAAYVIMTVIVDAAIILPGLDYLKAKREGLLLVAVLMAAQASLGFMMLKWTLNNEHEWVEIWFAVTLLAYLIFYSPYLFAAAGRYFEPILSSAAAFASSLISATTALLTAVAAPASLAALALSLAYFTARLHSGDYRGAAKMLYLALISALALLFSLLL